jgi:hypothetical protein
VAAVERSTPSGTVAAVRGGRSIPVLVVALALVGLVAPGASGAGAGRGATAATPRADDPWPLEVSFADVPPSHPFHDDIDWLAGHGIATGFDGGDFRPRAAVTRQTLAGVLAAYDGNRAGPVTPCTTPPFPDVPTSNPFCAEIAWLARHDLVAGYPDGTFRPTAPISRQTFAAVLHHFHGDGDDGPGCPPGPFPDVPASSTFCDDIAWLDDHGIAGGHPDGTFRPTAGVARQTLAALLHRYDDALAPGVPYDFDGDGAADFGWIDGDGWHRVGETDPFFLAPNEDFGFSGNFDGHGSWEAGDSFEGWITAGARGTIDFDPPDTSLTDDCDGPLPVPADYDGDGDTDAAWFNPWDATWHVEGADDEVQFGLGEVTQGVWCDAPVPADYDGDGDADIAVYRPTDGGFHLLGTGLIATLGRGFPTAGDWDGDGDAEPAVLHQAGSEVSWEVAGGGTLEVDSTWAVPAAADYDGDGDDDLIAHEWDPVAFIGPGVDLTIPTANGIALTVQPWLVVNIIRLTFLEDCAVEDDCPDLP